LALTNGAKELLSYCKENNIRTILASGSIVPILEIYQEELGLDYIIGPRPKIKQDLIDGISEADFPADGNFKVVGISAILQELQIEPSDCVAIGDSRGDVPMFEMAAYAIALNPKIDLSEYTDRAATDLSEVITILQEIKS
jgi:phosphoserine phosphatase